MDAYSISYTSPSRRGSSKIYQDLKTLRLSSLAAIDAENLLRRIAMGVSGRRTSSTPGTEPHVGIVGAGLAGLRCADILCRYGFRVTIIEGRSRVGGRMVQARLPNGHLVDLGPNWIHGTTDNPMLELAKKTGTAVGSWDSHSHMFNQFGDLFPLADGEKYSDMMWTIIQDAFKHSNTSWATIPPEESLWDFFQRKVVEYIPATEDDYEKKRSIVLQVSELWGAFVGSPITSQSLKFFWLEECIEGENLFCADTYERILETVAKPAKDHATIKYESRVQKIHLGTESTLPGLWTDEDNMLEFDELVLTTPLGWLKKNEDAFEPALPERLQQAIRNVGYGCLEKVYISFPKAFWLAPNEAGRTVKGFCQWLAPNYAPESNPAKWNQEIVELASSGLSSSHATLLFYIYGDESEFITERVSEAKTPKERDDFIYGFFRPYFSRLPGYDASSADCTPTACLTTDWLRDDLAGNGSYCNFQVGLAEGDEDIRIMRHGVPESKLWLAGEHTAPFVALGTAAGAYWAGEGVARRIADVYGKAGRAGTGTTSAAPEDILRESNSQ